MKTVKPSARGLKGIFKIEQITSTNPIAVGDIVDVEPEDVAENTAVITGICDRKNYIARSSPHSSKLQSYHSIEPRPVLLIATLKEPKTSQGFIDRCFVSAEAYHIPPIVVFNKIDLYKKKEWDAFEKLQNIYGIHRVSRSYAKHENGWKVWTPWGICWKTRSHCFFGHSGVGKSTVINYIIPDLELSTKEVSGWSGKGMHTTTFAEMFDLPSARTAKIIDTPGLREFAITDIERAGSCRTIFRK
jgi:ribosome biogenesis GTPase